MSTTLKVCLLSTALSMTGAAAFAQEAPPAETAPAAAAPAAAPELKFSGYINGSITTNPDSPADKENFGLPFTDRSNRPILNQLSLVAEKATDMSQDYSVGFRLQGMWGSDARLTHFLGVFDLPGSHPRNQFDIVEGDVAVHTPWLGTGGTDFKIGMYPTPLGYEVIDPRSNLFASHSYIYTFGLPLKHTGVLATTHANSTWDVWYGVDTGSNTTFGHNGDENGTAAFIIGFGLNNILDGKVTVLALSHIGPEGSRLVLGPAANSTYRYFNDIIVTTKMSDALTLVTELNWVRDDAAPVSNAYGVAQYVSYTVSDTLSANARAEVYRDANGFFVGEFPGNNDAVRAEKGLPNGSIFPGKSTYGEVTLGVTWKPPMPSPFNVAIRPEIRYDGSLSGLKAYDVFTKSSQFTAAIDASLTF